ncbi:hypothetical protein Desaci_2327 [Desulfosporosinus acidiphilus SJ4]|uniref:Uncharacterized protein n=1 Tax=Desulfosporosinus acidiphilus (strain DSM 22704 / JCM 16185 / SJ4) TaxID=646529 RepID=I4D656_DESAJ|nr:hypothetical protein [Desulfosporosinus acidiphilus]AFM41280.1 hypothetical protein Desaci_2327 [Desulfosporosinus acidiphilus SJ4]
MSNLTLNRYIPAVEKIKQETGEREYPIWLLVNPKHPAVRHNIWTPVLAEIQDKVFRVIHSRIDTSDIYIRNAVKVSELVPNTLNWWGVDVAEEIDIFKEIVNEHKPKIIISFGAFPFEFLRRAYQVKPEKGPKFWSTANLGQEFGKAIKNFDITKTNRIPLLRRVVETAKFTKDPIYVGRQDGETYFHYVGTQIADKIIEHKDSLNIWI